MTKAFRILTAFVLLSTLLAVAPLRASAAPPPPDDALLPPWMQTVPAGDGPWVVRAFYSDRQMVDDLAAWIEPWEVHHDLGYLVVAVDRAGYQRMRAAGFTLQVDAEATARLNQPAVALPGQGPDTIPGYPCYRTVEETYADAAALAAAYPHLATWSDIGDSWEKVNPGGNTGYDLMVLRITNSAIAAPKPAVFFMSSIHAREYTPAEMNMRFAEYLLENYGVDPDVTWLLDYNEVHLLFQANPDGRKMAEAGDLWRKNTDSTGCTGYPNDWGVDLNRNYPFQWGCCGGSSGTCYAETYRGPSAGSEPETQAVLNYVRAQFPDQRGPNPGDPAPADAMGIFLDIHSYSQLVLWAWGYTPSAPPNSTALTTLGRKFAYFNGYEPEQSYSLYVTDGTTVDWAYGELGLAAYTFELGTAFFQDCSTFENVIVPDNFPALIYALKAARTPYMTPAGPDALNVTAVPGGAVVGDPVQLTATINDTRYNNSNGTEPVQNVVAAEYYIDVPPWITTTVPVAYPMTAVDGAFNETIEDVEATLDTTGLSSGRHILFVRGRDAAGNWGAFSATFLYILDPEVAPLIEGYVRDAATNLPLQATVAGGAFQTTSDPLTGYYQMRVISGTYDLTATGPTGYAPATVAGVVAQDYETVRQDFTLYPICAIFADDVESGNQGWTPQAPWAITTEASHSATHSWTESPGGNYSNNRNTSLTSQVFDLSGYEGVALGFWHIYDTEAGWDYCYVEVSDDGGSSWNVVATYSGPNHTTWSYQEFPVPVLDHQPDARVRFRFTSDTNTVRDGWHVDDIALIAGGAGCVTPLAPTAEFASNSPVNQGDPVRFTNQTVGSTPLSYGWDFGDGVGTSTDSDPSYTYAAPGTFDVTLWVTNSVGSDSVTHPVTVLPGECISLTAVTIAGETTGEPGVYTFTASVEPANASEPISYLWDNGDTAATSVRTLDAGSHTLVVTATNCTAAQATDTHEIVIVEPCVEVESVALTLLTAGTIYTDTLVEFSADIAPDDTTMPYHYAVDYGDGTPVDEDTSGDDPLLFSHTYAAVGDFTVVIEVWNCEMAEPVSDEVIVTVVEQGTCVDLSGVAILGETTGYPGVYTFTTVYEPTNATLPILYLWDDGGAEPVSVRALDVGTHTLVVTATNCAESPVTDTHEITIVPWPERIYLPILLRLVP